MDADERARLRALAEQAVTCTEGVGNMLMDRRYRYYLEATPDVVLRLLDDVERLSALCETLKREAQLQAQEMRTQRAIVRECYQAATGSTGEPGDWNGANPVRELRALAEPAPGAQDAERAVNAEGPPGSYGCKCTSRNALECARQAYYAGVEARERCGCLCHQWTDSGPWRCLTGDGR